jgi:hypothetical protein
VFAVALALRVIVAIELWLVAGGSIYEDDAGYTRMAIQAAHHQTSAWTPYTHWLFHRTATLLVPMSWLYRFAGSSTLPGQLAVAVLGATVAAMVARLAWRVAGTDAALISGLLIAVLPSQVVMSSVMLKDAAVWLLLAAVAVVAARPRDRTRLDAVVGIALISLCLTLLAYLRLHTFVVASMALLLTSLALAAQQRRERTAGLLIVSVVIPIAIGVGPVGISFVTNHAGSIEDIRASGARGRTAIAAATAPSTTATTTYTTNSAGPDAADRRANEGEGAARDIGYLPHGLFALLFEPVPWRAGGSFTQRLAQLESVVWYPLLVFALAGLFVVWRRLDRLLYALVVGVGTLLMWALIEGNIGTAYRHRGEFAWVVCCLASFGIASLVERRADARRRS